MDELERISKNLSEAIKIRESALVTGKVASWEEYRYLSGVLAGLKGAKKEVDDTLTRWAEDMDFD